MILSYENIAHYLLEKGLITPESIIAGEFTIRDQSSRNLNFVINREYTPSYLVKQIRAQDQEKRETLRTEATCYWLANNDDAYQHLKKFLSEYHLYDYLHHILVIGFLPDVENLHEYFRDQSRFTTAIAEKTADILTAYHTHEPGVVEKQRSYSLFKKRKPWVFTLTENSLTEWLNNSALKGAEKQSLKLILENKSLIDHTRDIAEEWETISLIHGDVKFTNFLIKPDLPYQPDIRLIDWELADIGDPLWDVAAVIQNYLTLWIGSELAIEYKSDLAHMVSLEDIQPSIAAFWNRYVTNASWNEELAQMKLEKTVRYCALKLVHTCFESVQDVQDMSIYSAKILQLSLNLLNHSEQAIDELLNIQPQTKKHEHINVS